MWQLIGIANSIKKQFPGVIIMLLGLSAAFFIIKEFSPDINAAETRIIAYVDDKRKSDVEILYMIRDDQKQMTKRVDDIYKILVNTK